MARPNNAKYSASHEWATLEDGILTVGIIDHAVEALGDIAFVDLPDAGREVERGETIIEIESVKAVGEVYAPVSGTIEAVNEGLGEDPAGLGSDPFGGGWLVKIRVSDDAGFGEMIDLAAYEALLENAE